MTVDEAYKQVEEIRAKVQVAARRRLFPMGMVGDTSSMTLAARLTIVERTLAAMMAERSEHVGTLELKAVLEMRDYWEEVLKEVES